MKIPELIEKFYRKIEKFNSVLSHQKEKKVRTRTGLYADVDRTPHGALRPRGRRGWQHRSVPALAVR